MKKQLMHLYNALSSLYGPQHWWPAESQWEVAVGAILTQNTNWTNVEKAIVNLKKNKILAGEGRGVANCSNSSFPDITDPVNKIYPEKLLETPSEEIAELIRPSGYYNMKSKRLRFMAEWWLKNHNKNSLKYREKDIPALRTSLLRINGVGPETADTIILYAFNLPVFVVDTYTKRISNVYLNTSPDISYDDLQSLFMGNLPHERELFNEYHALIVRLGKEKNWQTELQDSYC